MINIIPDESGKTITLKATLPAIGAPACREEVLHRWLGTDIRIRIQLQVSATLNGTVSPVNPPGRIKATGVSSRIRNSKIHITVPLCTPDGALNSALGFRPIGRHRRTAVHEDCLSKGEETFRLALTLTLEEPRTLRQPSNGMSSAGLPTLGKKR